MVSITLKPGKCAIHSATAPAHCFIESCPSITLLLSSPSNFSSQWNKRLRAQWLRRRTMASTVQSEKAPILKTIPFQPRSSFLTKNSPVIPFHFSEEKNVQLILTLIKHKICVTVDTIMSLKLLFHSPFLCPFCVY